MRRITPIHAWREVSSFKNEVTKLDIGGRAAGRTVSTHIAPIRRRQPMSTCTSSHAAGPCASTEPHCR